MDFDVHNRSRTKSGLTQILYAEVSDIATIAELDAVPTTQASKVMIYTDHLFNAPEGFRKMYVNLEKTMGNWEGLGDRYSKTGKASVVCFIPGSRKQVAAMIKDDPEMIFLLQGNPCQSGEYEQIGTKCDPATIVPTATKYTTGTIDGQTVRGYEITFECYQDHPIFYTGAVTMATD